MRLGILDIVFFLGVIAVNAIPIYAAYRIIKKRTPENEKVNVGNVIVLAVALGAALSIIAVIVYFLIGTLMGFE